MKSSNLKVREMVLPRFVQSGTAFECSLISLVEKAVIFFRSICDSPGAAFFAAARELVDGSPSAGFRIFRADIFFLVAGFDVRRLTFLFVSVTGFIALRHGCSFLLGVTFWVQ